MAIQLRRGAYTDLDPTRLLPGEIAVVLSGDPNTTSGQAIYICFATGTIERLATTGAIDAVVEELEQMIEDFSETVPNLWTGAGAGSNYSVDIGTTYEDARINDFYKDTSRNKLYLVSGKTNTKLIIIPVDNTYIESGNPPTSYNGYTYPLGAHWFNTTTGKEYYLKEYSGTPPSVTFVWTAFGGSDSDWEELETVDVEDLSDTPDGFIWDVGNYDDLKIIINGVTSVTGNRNIDLRLTTSGGASEHIGMFANLINQTSKDIKLKATRNTGTATMELTGSIMRSAYPYVDDASYNKDVAVPSGAITKVELIISGGGGLATGDITLLGRKRG